jgi:archaellum component FlaC
MRKGGVEMMTDKERLEEIKEWFNADGEMHEFQIEWLIEQAEKVDKQYSRIEVLEEYIGQLEHEKQLLYGRLNMIRDLTSKKIE